MSIDIGGPPATGEVLRRWLKRAEQWQFAIRFRYVHPDTNQRAREYIRLGREDEGWNELAAERKLREYLQQARAGVYRPAVAADSVHGLDPTFHEFSTYWLQQKRADLSDGPYDDYRNLLVRHLLPFFANDRVTQITYERVHEYRSERLRTSRALQDARDAGFPLIEHSAEGKSRPRRIFGERQINASIALLGQRVREHRETIWCARGVHEGSVLPQLTPAGRRRPVDRRDRPGVPRTRGDHGAAHQPGETTHQGGRSQLRPAAAS